MYAMKVVTIQPDKLKHDTANETITIMVVMANIDKLLILFAANNYT